MSGHIVVHIGAYDYEVPKEVAAEFIRLDVEIARLRADQEDWRKGIALIASALGTPADLSCVSLADCVLRLRAEVERLTAPLTMTGVAALDRSERERDEAHEETIEAIALQQQALAQVAVLMQALKDIPARLLEAANVSPGFTRAECWGVERDLVPALNLTIIPLLQNVPAAARALLTRLERAERVGEADTGNA